MRFIRSRPWRSRAPWFNTRAGARRRGYRDDELVSIAHDVVLDDHVVMATEREVMIAHDGVLVDAAARPIPEGMQAARVDLSGLQAMAARELEPRRTQREETMVAFGWLTDAAQSDDDAPVSRHSA